MINPWPWPGVLIHGVMLKKPQPQQTALEMVTLESLVPLDYLVCKIDGVNDFSFIYERGAGRFCPIAAVVPPAAGPRRLRARSAVAG